MSETWNSFPIADGYMWLLNKKRTSMRFRKGLKVDVAKLMSLMEEHEVPLAYSDEIEEIYFTYLSSKFYADHLNGKIRLSCTYAAIEELEKNFVHELAHNMDDREFISIRDSIIKEKKLKVKYINDKYAKKNVGEYVAVGFEIFYFGTKKEKRSLKRHNSKLYNVILDLHKKYRSKR